MDVVDMGVYEPWPIFPGVQWGGMRLIAGSGSVGIAGAIGQGNFPGGPIGTNCPPPGGGGGGGIPPPQPTPGGELGGVIHGVEQGVMNWSGVIDQSPLPSCKGGTGAGG